MPFIDRVDAGRRLAERLSDVGFAGQDVVVLGLPRGGVPVAFEVAQALQAPLDVLVVRKLGAPFHPELAMGAIGEGGVTVLNERVLAEVRVTGAELAAVEARERQIVDQRVSQFRRGNPPARLAGKTALIIDDGIATGSTARAACQVARAHGAARVVLAVPVAPPQRLPGLERDADEVICLETPTRFFAVGQFYTDFSQISDQEVSALLTRAAANKPPAATSTPAAQAAAEPDDDPAGRDEDVRVQAGPVTLSGHLSVPEGTHRVVIFAHGSGSSRHSPRNQFVAAELGQAGLGTLLFDLLTPEEEDDRANVFDIELLAGRLNEVTAWLRAQPGMAQVRIGYFGASTGAGAALWAAAAPDSVVTAVVSRGGRPDLAAARLSGVRTPTLLIVGGRDDAVLEMNRKAQAMLRCESRLAVVPGATHLFEEPGTLQIAADLARDWFITHLETKPTPA
ncbi:MAG: phosphoribosyltransferase family protein [Dermatophilaceae bacterium]|nr:phosphoribosyltransferase [Intrasporangiaceae bacterium]